MMTDSFLSQQRYRVIRIQNYSTQTCQLASSLVDKNYSYTTLTATSQPKREVSPVFMQRGHS